MNADINENVSTINPKYNNIAPKYIGCLTILKTPFLITHASSLISPKTIFRPFLAKKPEKMINMAENIILKINGISLEIKVE